MLVKKRIYINSTRNHPASQFDKRLILQIVKEVEEGLPRKQACSIYGMAYGTMNEWIRKYASQDYQAHRRRVFSDQDRRKIVGLIKDQKITKQQAQELYKIGRKALNDWILQVKRQDAELGRSNSSDMPIELPRYSSNELSKQLIEANLKIKALETMIDIAEQKFKISIRKKSGAKQ
jgi:transposase-like protein